MGLYGVYKDEESASKIKDHLLRLGHHAYTQGNSVYLTNDRDLENFFYSYYWDSEVVYVYMDGRYLTFQEGITNITQFVTYIQKYESTLSCLKQPIYYLRKFPKYLTITKNYETFILVSGFNIKKYGDIYGNKIIELLLTKNSVIEEDEK